MSRGLALAVLALLAAALSARGGSGRSSGGQADRLATQSWTKDSITRKSRSLRENLDPRYIRLVMSRRLLIGSALLALPSVLALTLTFANASVLRGRIHVSPSSGSPSTVFRIDLPRAGGYRPPRFQPAPQRGHGVDAQGRRRLRHLDRRTRPGCPCRRVCPRLT